MTHEHWQVVRQVCSGRRIFEGCALHDGHTHTHTLKQAHSTEGQFLVCKVCACAARESGGCDGDVADFAAIRLTLLCLRLAPTVDTRP